MEVVGTSERALPASADPSPMLATAACGLVLAGCLAYLPTFGNGFVNYDDPDYVTRNPNVRVGITWSSVHWAMTTRHASNWHPLTWVSHQLDSTLFGPESSAGPHAVSLLLHLASSVTLLVLLVRTTHQFWPSWGAALLFTLHPANVENVAWISQRKSVLSTFLLFVSFVFYASYASRPSMSRYLACLSSYALGLCAKPMLVTGPLLLLLIDYWPLRRLSRPGWGRCVWEKAPFLVLAAISCGLTLWAQQQAISRDETLSIGVRVANAVVSYERYLKLFIWPSGLAVLYPLALAGPALAELASALVVLLCVTTVVYWFRGRGYPIMGWCWYLVALLPVVGIVQVGVQSIADRYVYVPFIGLFMMSSWAVADLASQARWVGRVSVIAGLAAAVILGTLTFRQTMLWHDSITLFEQAVGHTRDNFVAHVQLAEAYQSRGNLKLAAEHQEAAYKAGYRNPETMVNLGTLWANLGRAEDAKRVLREAAARHPKYAPAHLALAEIALGEGDRVEGIQRLRETLRLDPGNKRARELMGR